MMRNNLRAIYSLFCVRRIAGLKIGPGGAEKDGNNPDRELLSSVHHLDEMQEISLSEENHFQEGRAVNSPD